MKKIDENEKQHEGVLETIRAESLDELYGHKNLIAKLLECLKIMAKDHFISGIKIPNGLDVNQEIAMKETMAAIEKEIEKKEKEQRGKK